MDLPKDLEYATHYAVLNGGKRVRPALTLLCAEAVGGNKEEALNAAIAVEFIHCFSLVHDDLPSIDDDCLRRGKPTLHVETNEAMAILTGDNLLALAFLQVAISPLKNKQKTELTMALASATKDMVGGQIYDSLGQLPQGLSPIESVELVHRNKTGALIRNACKLGAICGNANEEQLDAITNFGDAIGLMFQIVDDFIDLESSSEHAGKTTGKDLETGKLTYPAAIGIEASKKIIESLKNKANESTDILGNRGESLRSVNLWLAHRTR